MGCSGCGSKRTSALQQRALKQKQKLANMAAAPKTAMEKITKGGIIATPVKLVQVFEKPERPDLVIEAVDAPEPNSKAYHRYAIKHNTLGGPGVKVHAINFQKGPIKEKGVNGVSVEALLSICKHRLECFQQSEYACSENHDALVFIEDALEVLNNRTKARIQRGVEGKNEK